MGAKPQRILVTGGRGRLAGLLAGHFRGGAFAVERFSRTTGPGLRPLAELGADGALAGADFLVHLAWSTLPAVAEISPALAEREDLPLLRQLLSRVAACPAGRKPLFVFFSSGGAVYGNAPGRPSREDDACHPIGRYGRAKLEAERIITEQAALHGFPAVILRVSNPYGYPVPAERQQGLIPHAIRCAMSGQPLALWGDGSARKDFLHCDDLLAALEAVFMQRPTGTYNVASGQSHRVREVLDLVEKHCGRRIALAPAPAPAWDVHDSLLDRRKFSQATGWQPLITLDEGIRRAAQDSRI